MPIPDFQTLMLPVLRALADDQPSTPTSGDHRGNRCANGSDGGFGGDSPAPMTRRKKPK